MDTLINGDERELGMRFMEALQSRGCHADYDIEAIIKTLCAKKAEL